MATPPSEGPVFREPATNWQNVIQQHVTAFRAREKVAYDRALAYTNGNAWAEVTQGLSEVDIQRTSTNLIFPIVETAMTSLVPPKPSLTMRTRAPADSTQVQAGEALINYFLTTGRYRRELARSTYHTVLYGLGVMKTGWDAAADRAVANFVDPRNYFCDMTALREEDLKYEIEATLLSRKEVMDKVEAGIYPSAVLETAADQYPTWMLPSKRPDQGIEGAAATETKNLMNYQSWYLIYEVYDRENGVVHHYTPASNKPILTDELVFRPYDHLVFNFNGENCRGLSEVALILDNQREYNWTESYLLTILRNSIPGTYYDQKLTSTDKEQKRLTMPIGGLAGVNVPPNKSVAEMFFSKPLPQVPPLADQMMAGKRDTIAAVSSLAAAQRGQIVGAKTATELAFIKGQIQDRLSARQRELFDLTTRVGEKMYLLAQRYMRDERVLEVTGGQWLRVEPDTLEGIHVVFEMSTYSATESNPAVRAESIRNAYPLLSTNPLISQKRLTEELLRASELPLTLLLTDEEMAAQAQAAAPPPGMPGAPGAPGAPAGAVPPAPFDPNAPPPVELPNRVAGMEAPMNAPGAPPPPPPV
jgi:hypothetical protein